MIGCAIAYELARRGAAVRLIDDRAPGMGATQASAGILAPYVEAESGGVLLDLTVRSLKLYDDFIKHVTSDSNVALTYSRTGTLQVAVDAEGLNALRGRADRIHKHGGEAELLDAKSAALEEPHLANEICGAMLIPAHGFVDAGELARALAAAAGRHEARVEKAGRVRRIAAGANGSITVDTGDGAVAGDAVVLATGSWAGQVAIEGADTRLPVRPIRGQLLRLAWPGTPLKRVVWSDRCYLVPWHDGTLLVGATTEDAGFEERTTVAGVRDLLEAACELIPHAWTAGFLEARVGLRPATPDELPIIGASAVVPNLIYATGHYRNGVLLAPVTARLVADAIIERTFDETLTELSPRRFGEL